MGRAVAGFGDSGMEYSEREIENLSCKRSKERGEEKTEWENYF